MNPAERFELGEEVVVQRFETETLLVNMANEFIYTISGSGIDILEMLVAGEAIGQIVSRLVDQTDAGVDEIGPEVERLVGELRAEVLIRPAP